MSGPEELEDTSAGFRMGVQIVSPPPDQFLNSVPPLVSRANVTTPLCWCSTHVAHSLKRMTCMSEVMGLGLEVDCLQ
jgi:hypothetical protein